MSFTSIFWTWGSTRLANKIRMRRIEPEAIVDRVRARLRVAVFINLLGQLLTLLSTEQVVGLLIARVLLMQGFTNPPPYGAVTSSLRALDIYIVQANTNTLFAHFLSLASSLWLITNPQRGGGGKGRKQWSLE